MNPPSLRSYGVTGDRLGSDAYDANGNTVGAEVRGLPAEAGQSLDVSFTYQYDFENRILSASSAQSAVQILYDGDGNRVRKTVNGNAIHYLTDDRNLSGYVQVLSELITDNGELITTRSYAYGLDLISQTRITDNQELITSFYGYDGHGNTRFLTDETGLITDSYDYDAFGTLIEQKVRDPMSGDLLLPNTPALQSSITPNLYLYCGEQFDPDLGLYFLRARYMDTDRGRFWTMDTFEGFNTDPLSLHKYLYCGADPVNWTDPSGRERLISLQMAQSVAVIAWKTVSNTMVVYNAAMAVVYLKGFASCVYSVWQFNAANNTNGSADTCFPLFTSGLSYTFKTIFWGLARMTLLRHGFDPFTGEKLGW